MSLSEKERLQKLSQEITDFAFNYMSQFDDSEYDELMRSAVLLLKPLKTQKTMFIVNKNSQWNFWDVFRKTVNQLMELSTDHKSKDRNIGYERLLIRFIERLPSGDYSKIREEWNNST